MRRREALKSILVGPCLALLSAGGLATIVGSGGGGGSSRTPLGALRFLNDRIACGGRIFSIRATLAGRNLYSSTNRWSGCANFAPNSYRVDFYFVCGGRAWRLYANNIPVVDMCTTDLSLRYLGGNRFGISYPRRCPGVCPTGDFDEDVSAKSSGMEFQELILDGPIDDLDLEEFESVD